MALGAQFNASKQGNDFAKAHEIIELPMRQAMQMAPTPDFIWRTAKKDHTLGSVQAKAGDKIYLSIVQATQEDLRTGSNEVCPIFGGDRSNTLHPIHACPGFEWASAFCSASSTAVVEHQAKSG